MVFEIWWKEMNMYNHMQENYLSYPVLDFQGAPPFEIVQIGSQRSMTASEMSFQNQREKASPLLSC